MSRGFFSPTFVSCYRFLVTFRLFQGTAVLPYVSLWNFAREICARSARIDPHAHAQRLTAVFLEPVFDSSSVLFLTEFSFKSERNQRPILIPPFFFTRCSFLVHIFIYFAENYSNANLRETFSLSKFLHEESNCIDLSQKGEWFLED